MKIHFKTLSILIVMSLFCAMASCENLEDSSPEINPFAHGGNERNMILVISDIHLGADLSYAECRKNLPALEKLLNNIKASPNVKELVIAGDLIDEWFVPANIDTYQGKDQADFVKRVAAANNGVFNVLNSIIQEGKILVIYVPGNHDLSITAASIEAVLPGISQARETVQGLGTYSPPDYPYIAIEHGHRYNFFCAPDPISNQKVAEGTIMPPGYFFTRVAALYVAQGHPAQHNTIPVITPNTTGSESQDLLFRYWKDWAMTLKMFPINNTFDEQIILTNVNGFTGKFSVNDLLPHQIKAGGLIEVNLYNGTQDNWEARQTLCNVAVHTPASRSIDSVMSATETDYQSSLQYFMNPASAKRIVVFGHTHGPKILAAESYDHKKCIYANSGTWIDHNPNQTTMNFVVITPQSNEASSKTYVKLYNFENEVVTEMAEESIRY